MAVVVAVAVAVVLARAVVAKTVAVGMAAVAAAVGKDCNNVNEGRGVNGSSDDGGCSDGILTFMAAVLAMGTAMAVARRQRHQ